MRNTIERRQEIALMTQDKGRVEVDELAKLFSLSQTRVAKTAKTGHSKCLIC